MISPSASPEAKTVLTRQLMKSNEWNIGLPVINEPFQKRGKCCYAARLPCLIQPFLLGPPRWQPSRWAKQLVVCMENCQFYGYSLHPLTRLFDYLILSLFTYGIEDWGSACQRYLDRIDNFCKRACWYGYTMDILPRPTSTYRPWFTRKID